MQWRLLFTILMIISLAACNGDAQPTQNYVLGDVLLEDDFSSQDPDGDGQPDWETFALETADINFGAADGQYIATSRGGGYIWGRHHDTFSNTVTEVTTTQEFTREGHGIFGVMCRTFPGNTNHGYYFLIRSDGYYGIRVGDGERVRLLVPWTQSRHIKTGDDAVNTIRAVCIDDYLALYINDRFMAETTYDWLEEGLSSFAINSTEGIGIAVTYDDITIWEAELE